MLYLTKGTFFFRYCSLNKQHTMWIITKNLKRTKLKVLAAQYEYVKCIISDKAMLTCFSNVTFLRTFLITSFYIPIKLMNQSMNVFTITKLKNYQLKFSSFFQFFFFCFHPTPYNRK